MIMSRSQASILVVDDDEGHCELVRRNLQRGGVSNPIVPLTNGSMALDYIFRRGSFADRSAGGELLVLLDINMPGIDGIEVLRQIRSHPDTRSIPVLMLTTAESPREIDRCYEYRCNLYLTKSGESARFIEAVQRFSAGEWPVSNAVLIIEDDYATAELERRALAGRGTDTVIVSKVGHALDLLEERSFDAILLDYHLPDGDPWAVVAAAEMLCPQVPVVVITGQGNEMIASEAITRGVAAYIKKSGTCWEQIPGIVDRVTALATKKEFLRINEEQLRLKADQAEKASKAKSEFLASMSHELRTPLSAVIGFGYLLDKSNLSEDQRQMVTNIQVAGRALLGVVNDVLDLSKIEAGEMSLENEPLDLPGVLLSVVQMLGQQAKDKGIELIVPPLAELPYRVTGDASRLRQVIVNLVNNAIKFTEAGQVVVTVKCAPQGSEHVSVRCEVKDSGIGIEADALERLFLAFAQADATITKRFGGTGLGLSIARHLVKLMGGEIGVTSTVAVGSTFWFEITLEQAPATPVAPRVLRIDAHERLDGLRALVVDDSELNQEIVRRILEGQGAIVTCCSDGASAVELLRADERQFDIVLMDVQMPVLDGNEATRRIRHELGLATLPIIGLTAGALLSDRDRSLKAGMNDLVGKPFDTQVLFRKVRMLVPATFPI
jgi:signal transduction histidine kinase